MLSGSIIMPKYYHRKEEKARMTNRVSFDRSNSRVGISNSSPDYTFDAVGDRVRLRWLQERIQLLEAKLAALEKAGYSGTLRE
jgi:hypothetical protein